MEHPATIQCTSQQTRFHTESPNYREIDIKGLHIVVTSGEASGGKSKHKALAKDGNEILSNANLQLKEGRRYALIGRNGSGKSTLLKSISEKLIPGIPENTRVAILQQTRLVDSDEDAMPIRSGDGVLSVVQTVVETATAKSSIEQEISVLSKGINQPDAYAAVRALRSLKLARLQKRLFILEKNARLRSGMRGFQARKALLAFEKVVAESKESLEQPSDAISAGILQEETQEAIDMLEQLQIHVEPAAVTKVETKARNILTGLGFSTAQMAKPVSTLSGGWSMRAALASTLLQEADILILDEPTNYLDMLGIMWLQRYLTFPGESEQKSPTTILVSHDRDFIGLCTDLIILKDKQLTYFHGDLPSYEQSQSERIRSLTTMKEAQDKQKAHIEKTITNNLKAGKAKDDQNKIRQAKSRQKKLDNRWGLEVNAKGGRFKLNRDLTGYHLAARADIEIPAEERPVTIHLPEPPDLRFPGALLTLERTNYRYSKTSPLVIKDIDLSIGMGDRVGILGLNGAGKSTLIRVMVGETDPTSGTKTTHPRLRLGYYCQHSIEALQALGQSESTLTSLSLLTREVDQQMSEGEIRGLLSQLGLPGRIASDVPLCKLSGGQLVRCELARLLWRRPHCLVLDEVTTHLDYETVTALRQALDTWDGAVVAVSHDRWFMRGVVEGLVEDEQSNSDSEDSMEQSKYRRRAMYMLHGGSLKALDRGVDEFEDRMEEKIRKLLKGRKSSD
ncbi:P-loop containing nucleoside triphosphate hydrolase protein [Aspergillus bertholletiae]|uniref:P-loop containing nucleoside triphosphate hydrolase protein n=1 Tax=Aspergillus bertholletiae TaxID=1226010 RepID=A0A5N7BIV2_9EURO|nr:P-loop containing nucleoside triphosphate hydrolase protein [Aspergillus bertholletiae]